MANFWTILLSIAIVTSSMSVSGQVSGSGKSRQDFLNEACRNGGALCHRGAIIPSGTGTAVATVARPGSAITHHRPSGQFLTSNLPSLLPPGTCPRGKKLCPGLTSCITNTFDCSLLPASFGCLQNEKRCPQRPNQCIPSHVDCNGLSSGTTCTVPQGNEVNRLTTQVLICGDGSPIGLRCTKAGEVPVLTILVVQCKGSGRVNLKRISSLAVVSGPGGDGGAGIYQCSLAGSWEPMYDSPKLSQLTASCNNAGCGRVPQPSENMRIYRRWAWIRALYKQDNFKCTATLVSPTAAVTAAHCLTTTIEGNEVDTYDYELELPGPTKETARFVKPRKFYLHPNYNYNGGNPQNNVAVIFLNSNDDYILPTVCIAESHLTHTQNKKQLVFNLTMEYQQGMKLPKFSYARANLDPYCITTSNEFQRFCQDDWNIQRSQFCATHKDMTLTGISYGEPYLVEVGEQKETWVLMGVRTFSERNHPCSLNNSIYERVADNSNWLKNCVFNEASCNPKNP